jgi:hypothetical protein
MGAWVTSAFENDDALDWVSELEDGTVDLVRASLAVTESDYLELPDGSVAIAAAEVIAAAVGNPSPSLPASVTRWVDAHGASVADADVSPLRTRSSLSSGRKATTVSGRNQLRTFGAGSAPLPNDRLLEGVFARFPHHTEQHRTGRGMSIGDAGSWP